MRPVAKIAERISARVTIDANGCWVWSGDTVKGYDGYGYGYGSGDGDGYGDGDE
jgi:hypothetical protein